MANGNTDILEKIDVIEKKKKKKSAIRIVSKRDINPHARQTT